jgi:transcriptional regulator with XRE-family HTH domain
MRSRINCSVMKPIEHIRKSLFEVSQTAFAEIAGTTQASVSRWEQGAQEPSQSEMERIRSEAVLRGIDWDDRFFFEAPAECGRPE